MPISFNIELGIAYYNQGFFNVSIVYNENFGSHNSTIKIQLGENPKEIISGYINRTANNNGTPRIMGNAPLKTWIQNNFNQGDVLIVDILSKDLIKLREKNSSK